MNRREFGRKVAAGSVAMGFPAINRPSTIIGANDRIRTAFVGVRNRGGQVMDSFMTHSETEVAALCDIDAGVLAEAETNARKKGHKPAIYKDYYKMLEKGDFDAVVIATPDHWHALQFVAAADEKKDVYVEKPLSITVVEGRKMVQAARRNNIVSQVGTQRRSSPGVIDACTKMQQGYIGKITVTRGFRVSNMYPNGIGVSPKTEPPSGFDWNTWLGPRPFIPYTENYHPYKFRWHKAYSSQMGNWGVHYLDIMRYALDVEYPTRVVAIGGQYAVMDDRDIPDTMQVTYEWPTGGIGVFGQYEANGGNCTALPADVEYRGTKGNLYLRGGKYEVVPTKDGQFQNEGQRIEPFKYESDVSTDRHTRNFLDCMKTRALCTADIEIGHRSTSAALIGNIALELGEVLHWDGEKERFTNNDKANDLLHYEYRSPWKL
jgi:predicted dehydrogenase